MKTNFTRILATAALLTAITSNAQMGGPRGMGGMGGGTQPTEMIAAFSKLFGENSGFSADLALSMNAQGGNGPMSIPGKIAFDSGKSRFEMDLTKMEGGGMEGMADQMKSMGMDKIVIISQPEKKLSYMIYPGLRSYAEMPTQNAQPDSKEEEIKIDTSDLGEETVDGHPTMKKRVVFTDARGRKQQALTWNATDLKDFPIKIEANEQGTKVTISFKNVKLTKPVANLFEPPSNFKKYDNMMTMMQEQMMQRMGNGQGMRMGGGN